MLGYGRDTEALRQRSREPREFGCALLAARMLGNPLRPSEQWRGDSGQLYRHSNIVVGVVDGRHGFQPSNRYRANHVMAHEERKRHRCKRRQLREGLRHDRRNYKAPRPVVRRYERLA